MLENDKKYLNSEKILSNYIYIYTDLTTYAIYCYVILNIVRSEESKQSMRVFLRQNDNECKHFL